MLRRFSRLFSLFLLIIFTTFQAALLVSADPIQPANTPPLEIATPAAILMDAKTGQIIYNKSMYEKMYPASITKIMTAVIALEKGDLQSKIKMSKRAVNELDSGSSNVGLLEGEELSLDQLLHALMMESANEAANAIAESIGGSKEAFAKMMTQRAKELGAKNTNFVNPHGLPNPDHYTTAYDMAMITKHAMTIPKFREIVKTTSYIIPPTNKMPKEKELRNKNKLINQTSGYYYPYAIGVKTGYTIAAGSTLVSAASKDGVELIAVVLNSPIQGARSYMYVDSIKLFKYGFDNFVSYKMADKAQVLDKIKIKGSSTKILAVPQNDYSILLPKGVDKGTVKVLKEFNKGLRAPIKKGDVIGYLSFVKDGQNIAKVPIVANNNAKKGILSLLSMPEKKTFLSMTWLVIKWILFLVILAIIVLVSYAQGWKYYKKSKKRNRINVFKMGDR